MRRSKRSRGLTWQALPRRSAPAARRIHVAQHLRPSFPRDHLGREPRARDRLRRRRLPAAASRSPRPTSSPTSTSADPASRASPRSGASRTRCGSCPACSRTRRPARCSRPARRSPAHRQCRRALQGLSARSATRIGPATPTSPMTRSTASATIAAGGRSSARETATRVAAGAIARKVVPGMMRARRARPDRPAHDRSRELGLGRGRPQPVLLARRQGAARWADYLDGIAQGAAPRSARSSRSSPRAFLPGSARRSTASSTRTSPRR